MPETTRFKWSKYQFVEWLKKNPHRQYFKGSCYHCPIAEFLVSVTGAYEVVVTDFQATLKHTPHSEDYELIPLPTWCTNLIRKVDFKEEGKGRYPTITSEEVIEIASNEQLYDPVPTRR